MSVLPEGVLTGMLPEGVLTGIAKSVPRSTIAVQQYVSLAAVVLEIVLGTTFLRSTEKAVKAGFVLNEPTRG